MHDAEIAEVENETIKEMLTDDRRPDVWDKALGDSWSQQD